MRSLHQFIVLRTRKAGNMNKTLKEKDYKNIFYFEISSIPRGSYNNTAISNYLVDFARIES